MRQNIALIGFMGSGKSSIGRLLGKKLGFQFVDTDKLIVDRAGMEIEEIFARLGEPHFRDLETAALRSVLHLTRCVLATGGGVVLREENRRLLREFGLVVRLTAAEDVIFERVSRNTKRPLLHTENPRETISLMLAARAPAYEEAAQVTVDTSELPHDEAAQIILREARRAFLWQSAE